jgi:hypothetical protein
MRCEFEHGLYPNPSRRERELDGELSGRGGEQAGPCGSARIERRAQSRFGLGQALAATGADPQFAGQVAQGIGAILHRSPDVPV